MAEADADLKKQISKNLEGFGFEVTLLNKREGEKTPDLLVSKGEERFVIEVKSKGYDEQEFEHQMKRTEAGKVGEWSEPWSPRNTIAGIIRDGVEQLAAFPESERDFSLLWLHAEGIFPESQFEQLAHTLFGLTRVFSIRNRRDFDYECYYFHDSAFFRWRAVLDGAIISTSDKLQLCLNSYSGRVEGLRCSALAVALQEGVRDADALESQGAAIIADCDVDRRNTVEVIGYLQEKYNQEMLMHMHMGRSDAWFNPDASQESATNQDPSTDDSRRAEGRR